MIPIRLFLRPVVLQWGHGDEAVEEFHMHREAEMKTWASMGPRR